MIVFLSILVCLLFLIALYTIIKDAVKKSILEAYDIIKDKEK